MTDNVQDMTLEVLKGIQSALTDFRGETAQRFEKLDKRLDQLETVMRKERRNAAGMLVMMRATAGDFDARVTEIEERLAALEA